MPPPDAVSVALEPLQIIPSFPVMPDVSETATEAEGSGLTVIVVDAVPVQPATEVTVTVYVVVPDGVTEIEAPVEPLLQA